MPAWRVDHSFDYAVPADLVDAVGVGSLVRMPFGRRRVRGVVVGLDPDGATEGLESLAALVTPPPIAPPPLTEVLDWIARRYVAPRGRVYGRIVPPRVRSRLPADPSLGPGPEPATVARYDGGEELISALRVGASGVWSLLLLPGDDHGRVISELLGASLPTGSAALVTVPEVRFGSEVIAAVLAAWPGAARVDAGAGDAARAAGWLRLGAGGRLGIGGRSAVLAPARSLGLMILDEEHHPTYKEDRSPRYDARRVALERCRRDGAACVLVSSSPSLETGLLCARGDAQLVRPRRADERARRPVVEFAEPEPDSALTRLLHERIRDALGAGQRVALLAPRRGFARTLWCASCRHSVRCPRCEAAVAFDSGPRRVRCPRCSFEAGPPEVCPRCGAADFRYVGAGSERLEQQLQASFPRARVVRMDPEVLEGGSVDRVALEASDVYLTTWIGTKPALRPAVSLVGVLDADALIRRADFRAAERAYQAMVAMSEWAGPAAAGGRLLIQTSEPGHHALQAVVRADHGFFLERELEQRKELFYPPYSELVTATVWGGSGQSLLDEVVEVAKGHGATVLGPIRLARAAALRRGAEGEAFEALLKCRDALEVADALRPVAAGVATGTRLRLDVDPR